MRGEDRSFQSLLERAKEGEGRALEEIFRRCQPRLAILADLRLGKGLRRRIDVDDVLQEAFLTAYRKIEDFEGESERQLQQWLARIAENVIHDLARHHGAERRCLAREVPLCVDSRQAPVPGQRSSQWLASHGLSPLERMLRNERFDRLLRGLRELDEERREVILLARIRGLPLREVSRIMERTRSACAMLLLRAMRDLGRVLRESAPGGSGEYRLPDRSLELELGRDRPSGGSPRRDPGESPASPSDPAVEPPPSGGGGEGGASAERPEGDDRP